MQGILRLLNKKEEENVDFDEFLSGVKTVMLYDNYFEELEGLFKYLDTRKTGKVQKQHLLSAITKLRGQQEADDKANKCDLKVPHEDDVETALAGMVLQEEGVLNYDEYLVCLFKVTIDN